MSQWAERLVLNCSSRSCWCSSFSLLLIPRRRLNPTDRLSVLESLSGWPMSASSHIPTAVSTLLVLSVLLSSLTNGQTTGSSGSHHCWEESLLLYCTSLCSTPKTPPSNMSSHRKGETPR